MDFGKEKMSKNKKNGLVTSEDYTEDYFLSCCQGHDKYETTLGQELPLRILTPFNLANLSSGDVVLDIGSGRGELVRHSASIGCYAIGMDYSNEALKISRKTTNNFQFNNNLFCFIRGNSKKIPFSSDSFDVVFMLDVVEHLYQHELEQTLRNVYSILKPGGRLIIHTMPNLVYYQLGYPIYRFVQKLRGMKIPRNPRDRWKFSHVHVNEQTPYSLKKNLLRAGFKTKVFLQQLSDFETEEVVFVKETMKFLVTHYPFKLMFCNDILAIAKKEN